MFFELHEERKIGYKLLSEADLGIGTSHQTHIGLTEHALTFLSDRDTIGDAIFVYGDSFDYIDAHFDRIERSSGDYNAPKIKVGGRDCISVTSTIREIVKNDGKDLRWFLFWFGLKSEKIVFLLFNELSNDYKSIIDLGLNLDNITTGAKVIKEDLIDIIANFIENKINQNGLTTLKELEVVSQVENMPSKRFKKYDIDKANANFKKIGKEGEQLICNFLNAKLQKGEISNYIWYNEENESGLPYDFHIESVDGSIIYLDVKTTSYDFEQKIIFSSQEIDFIADTKYEYCVYRVYKGAEQSFNLRIGNNCKGISLKISSLTNDYKNDLSQIKTDLRSVKFAITPTVEDFNFMQEILLNAI